MTTAVRAQADAETHFRLRAQRAAWRQARGLALLDEAADRGAACCVC